jgi:hypothetical protein
VSNQILRNASTRNGSSRKPLEKVPTTTPRHSAMSVSLKLILKQLIVVTLINRFRALEAYVHLPNAFLTYMNAMQHEMVFNILSLK